MQFLLEIIFFLISISVCFYLPGKFLLNKLKLTLISPQDLFYPFVLGTMIFTLLAYIFTWVKLEVMVLPILLVISILTIKSGKWMPATINKVHAKPLIIVFILSIIFSLSMLVGGVYGNSISFRGDDLWHLALVNELRVNFPPDNPGFAGVPLRGYHFFYDFLIAKIVNIFPISILSLYFRFLPIFVAVLWGLGVYSLMYVWSKKAAIAVWAVFLTMFGGSFAFILRFRGHEGLSLDSAFGIQQPISSLINPPFAISIVIVIASLIALYKYLSDRESKWLVPIILLISLVTMFKVYAGIILIGGFIFLTFIKFLKKEYVLIGACLLIGILFFFTYWILADHQSKLIFSPLWAPHNVLTDNMPWYRYDEKIYTYTHLNVIKGIVETELYSLYVFLFGNLGTRAIGLLLLLLFLLKKPKRLSLFEVIVLSMTLMSIVIPLFFIQSGKVFEIIQMSWYFLFLVSLFSAFGFYKLFSLSFNKITKIILFILILILTLPSAYENYKIYFSLVQFSKISFSSPYFKAMQFLKLQGNYNETVLEIPDKNIKGTKKDVMSWYGSKLSTPSIAAFANKKTYLNNEYIDFAGVNIAPRAEFVSKIILLNNMSINSSFEYIQLQREVEQGLRKNKIYYIYSPYSLSSLITIKSIKQTYQNQSAFIYKVDVK